ncbi:MAG: glycosyltransferase [Myxococcota bacterium]
MNGAIEIAIVVYFLLMNSMNATLLVLSTIELGRARCRRWPELDNILLAQESTPPISIIAPAYNEEATIIDSVRAFLHLEYPAFTVVVVNDGSKDATMAVLRERFALEPVKSVYRREFETKHIRGVYRSPLEPRLLVVDKDNGGKADALNAGINVARTPLVCCVDADSLIDQRALLRMVEPFIYDPTNTIAVGGTIRLANGATVRDGRVTAVGMPRSWVARFQIIEYLRAFLFARLGLNRLGGNLIISGALGIFRRDVLVELKGYRTDTVGEDMELVVRMHRHMREQKKPYRICYVPDPICWTEAPEDMKVLGRQRHRWQRGLFDSLIRHRRMFFNPRYGGVGMLAFPMFVLFELLAPVLELFGYVYFALDAIFGTIDPLTGLLFFALANLVGFLMSLQALALDDLGFNSYRGLKVRLQLVAAAFLENFGYRQILLWHRLKGMKDFLKGGHVWGEMTRKGFASSAAGGRRGARAGGSAGGDGPAGEHDGAARGRGDLVMVKRLDMWRGWGRRRARRGGWWRRSSCWRWRRRARRAPTAVPTRSPSAWAAPSSRPRRRRGRASRRRPTTSACGSSCRAPSATRVATRKRSTGWSAASSATPTTPISACGACACWVGSAAWTKRARPSAPSSRRCRRSAPTARRRCWASTCASGVTTGRARRPASRSTSRAGPTTPTRSGSAA